MKAFPLFFTLWISFLGFSQNSTGLSLEAAIDYGLANNINLKNASLEIQKAYKEKWATIARGLPQISASANYQNFLELPVSLVPAEFFGGQKGEFAELRFGTNQNLVAGGKVEQLIFDGTYVVGIQAINVYLNISENLFEKTKIEIIKAIVNSYCMVLLADENVALLKKNAANLEENVTETQALFENGFAEQESVEQLKLTLSQINSQLDYAENLQKITRSFLKLALGYPEEEALLITDKLELLAMTKMELLPENNPDLSNNVDLKIAANNKASEALLLRLERAKALPTLRAFLNGNYTGNSDTFTFLEPNQKWFASSLFGVNLNIPIFSSLGRAASTQKAKIALAQANNNLELTEQQVALEFQQALNDFELSIKNYNTSKSNLGLASRIEAKNKVKFLEGMASSFELRQAQTQLYSAQNQYLNALKEVIVNKVNLETIINSPN